MTEVMRRNNVLPSRYHIVFIAAILLGLVFPFAAAGQSSSYGMKLPPVYQDKLDDFLVNNNVMKNNNAKTFTMNFVETEMEVDWKISKENQLLFIWHSVYKQVTDQDLYNGKDGDQKIAEDFTDKVVNARIKACSQKYRSCFTAYMNQRSAEAQQRSAETIRMTIDGTLIKIDEGLEILTTSISKYEQNQLGREALQELATIKQEKEGIEKRVTSIKTQLVNNQYSSSELKTISDETKQLLSDITNLRSIVARQRSADAQQRSADAQQNAMKLDSLWLKEDMLRFYDIYTRSPNIVKQEEINFMKKATNDCITQCKQYGIDYRAILLKETGDGKKVDAILIFYGIAY